MAAPESRAGPPENSAQQGPEDGPEPIPPGVQSPAGSSRDSLAPYTPSPPLQGCAENVGPGEGSEGQALLPGDSPGGTTVLRPKSDEPGAWAGDAGGSKEPREPCPELWMYYAKQCYYYAEHEIDWNSAKKSCEATKASLVTFKDRQEMDYILKRAGKKSYWVGLQKQEKGREWITGDVLDHGQFQTQGHEECGFIWSKNGHVISLSTCSLPRSSICKREPYT